MSLVAIEDVHNRFSVDAVTPNWCKVIWSLHNPQTELSRKAN
jgi:hypothetical protein